MKLKSKMRQMFSDELLYLIASVCDTARLESSQQKMKLLGDLLYTYDIKFSVLGGATNRFVLFIDGYAVKFALDSQGYRDNLIEYSICEELQPYVTKAYETNGYVLVAECVRTLQEADFIARKSDMLQILMTLSSDYLLGDVGYIRKNFTNWGIRDNGELVILDYAYCHRATEMLFTCSVCGEGILTYDHVFQNLVCTNKSVCHSVFTYDDKKSEQGDQVDLDMIAERKKTSLVLPSGVAEIEIKDKSGGRLVTKNGKKLVIVDNDQKYDEMMEAMDEMVRIDYDARDALDNLLKMAVEGNVPKMSESVVTSVSTEDTEYEVDQDYLSERIGRKNNILKTQDEDDTNPLDKLLAMSKIDSNSSVSTYDAHDDCDDEVSDLDALLRMAMVDTNSTEKDDSKRLVDVQPKISNPVCKYSISDEENKQMREKINRPKLGVTLGNTEL